jgi:hypothetical protein
VYGALVNDFIALSGQLVAVPQRLPILNSLSYQKRLAACEVELWLLIQDKALLRTVEDPKNLAISSF